jgi:hypothetical protein
VPETRTKRTTSGKARSVHKVPPAAEPHDEPLVCTVAFCPICAAVTTARGLAPDAVDHLLKAARELFLAARAVIDVRADDLADGSERPGPTPLEKIDIG